MEGVVQVQVDVTANGKIAKVSIYKSSGVQALDDATLEAAKRSTFAPDVINCMPVAASYIYVVEFQDRNGAAPRRYAQARVNDVLLGISLGVIAERIESYGPNDSEVQRYVAGLGDAAQRYSPIMALQNTLALQLPKEASTVRREIDIALGNLPATSRKFASEGYWLFRASDNARSQKDPTLDVQLRKQITEQAVLPSVLPSLTENYAELGRVAAGNWDAIQIQLQEIIRRTRANSSHAT